MWTCNISRFRAPRPPPKHAICLEQQQLLSAALAEKKGMWSGLIYCGCGPTLILWSHIGRLGQSTQIRRCNMLPAYFSNNPSFSYVQDDKLNSSHFCDFTINLSAWYGDADATAKVAYAYTYCSSLKFLFLCIAHSPTRTCFQIQA